MFNKNEFQFYKSISQVTQKDLLQWTKTYLTGIYNEERVIATDDYTYAVGDIPIMLVAHLDTVHFVAPADIYYDTEQQVIWSPQGIGADDRAGVYSILKILMDGYRPHVLFTTDEETGGKGARAASKELFPNLNFIIELDRRGKDDCVFYDCDNVEFETFINSFGFITDFGSFSDISYLCPEWKIAGVNLSIGYENEHTKHELLKVNHMFDTIRKVETIFTDLNVEKDKFEYVEDSKNKANGSDYYAYLDNWGEKEIDNWKKRDLAVGYNDGVKYNKSDEICYECFCSFNPNLIINVGSHGKFCGDCYPKVFSSCTRCGSEYKDRGKTHLLCEDCREGV